MPQQETLSSSPPPPPPSGYQLDSLTAGQTPPLPSGYKLDSAESSDGASIGARHGGALDWLEDLKGDIKYGTGATAPGRLLHKMGARGIYGGVSEPVGDFIGGPLIGPAKVAHGIGTIPSHPVRGLNETIEGAAQTAAPIFGATVPGAIPAAVAYGAIGKGTSKIAEGFGADPETAELIGSAASIAAPGAIPRIGRLVERNAGPIGRGVGVGTGIYEAARTKNPLWLLTGTPRATAMASDVAGRVGRGMQRMTLETGIPGPPTPEPIRSIPPQLSGPIEGEYVASEPAEKPPERYANASVVGRPALPASASVARDLPYRRGPGEIPPEDVNAPDPFVLGGHRGVRVPPRGAPKLLSGALEGETATGRSSPRSRVIAAPGTGQQSGAPGPLAAEDRPARIAKPNLRPSVTENPAVGDLTRAMQKSGMPMAERPNLLLKGSGRVNRILGPEEDLTNALAKSVRVARRQRGQ